MVIGNFSFAKNPELHFGVGQFKKLFCLIPQYNGAVLIVTGASSFRKSKNWKTLQQYLEENDIASFKVQVSSEPSPELINSTVAKFKNENVKLVVGIGGGSVMDAGKAISAMLVLDDSIVNYLEGVGTKDHPGLKVPFIAVPTTAGTGSEATKNAVISKVGKDGFKKSLRHDNFVPDYAIVDPELMIDCPADITAACGMDAFTQLLESYTSDNANPLTDSLAFTALEFITKYLVEVYENGNNLDARTAVAYGSLISGMTLANAGLGIIHGMASPVGGYFNIPHGVFCGTVLAPSIEMNIKKLNQNSENDPVLKKFAKVGNLFSKSESVEDGCNILIKRLYELTEKLNMPKLSEYGIEEKDLELIVKNTGNKNNPVKLTEEEIYEILKSRL
ncbi:MAG: iron-containing alcohol dehydrogenase [Melioribacteraceae bacterium]|nr:iron-containing alcohol dehydrogenase [Melioribacteraceae bacterium]